MKKSVIFLMVAICTITIGVKGQTPQPNTPNNNQIMPPNNPSPNSNPYPNNGFTPPLNNTVPPNNTVPLNGTNTVYPYNPSPTTPYNPSRHSSDSIRRRDSLRPIPH